MSRRTILPFLAALTLSFAALSRLPARAAPGRPAVLSAAAAADGLAVTTDGSLLAVEGAGYVLLWDLPGGRLQRKIDDASETSLAGDGSLLASCNDKVGQLWDPRTGRLRASLRGHPAGVERVQLSSDAASVATVANNPDAPAADPQIRLWDTGTGRQRHLLRPPRGGYKLAFSPDGRLLAADAIFEIYLWNARTGKNVVVLRGHNEEVNDFSFSPDGRLLASCSSKGELFLWEVASGKVRARLGGHTGGVSRVAFSPDGATLASSGDDRTVRLWDVASGQARGTSLRHPSSVRCLAFSADGRLLATGSDKNAYLWQLSDGERRHTLVLGNDVTALLFLPAGDTLAVTEFDFKGTTRLWDVASGRQKSLLQQP